MLNDERGRRNDEGGGDHLLVGLRDLAVLTQATKMAVSSSTSVIRSAKRWPSTIPAFEQGCSFGTAHATLKRRATTFDLADELGPGTRTHGLVVVSADGCSRTQDLLA